MVDPPLIKSISGPKLKCFFEFPHGNVENANVKGGKC